MMRLVPDAGWRDTAGLASPALLIFVFVAASTELGLVGSLLFALMSTAFGWFAYHGCFIVLGRIFWPNHIKNDINLLESRQAVTTTIFLLAAPQD